MTSVDENGGVDSSGEPHVNNVQSNNSNNNTQDQNMSHDDDLAPANTVESLLESEEFKREIHKLVSNQLKAGVKPVSALQQLSELLTQHTKLNSPSHAKDPSARNRTSGSSQMIPINDLRGQEGTGYSKEEKAQRCKLASLYRLVDLHGWTQNIYSHISVRCVTNENNFLINPFGLLFHEITASSLIKVDSEGNVVDPGSSVMSVNKAGWVLHSALHASRQDINCVLHLHVPDCIAVSCLKCGLLPLSCEASQLLASPDEGGAGVSYHDYFGILVESKERESLQKDLGPVNKVMLLRNHGMVVCAESVEEAWRLTRLIVTACQTQMRMIQLGGDAVLKTETSCSPSVRAYRPAGTDPTGVLSSGQLEFEAMMRLLDNGGYKTGYVYKQPNLLRRQQGPGASQEGLDGFEPGHYDYGDENEQTARIATQVRATRQKTAQRNEWLAKQSGSRGGSLERHLEDESES